jgi:hypothetical protein
MGDKMGDKMVTMKKKMMMMMMMMMMMRGRLDGPHDGLS